MTGIALGAVAGLVDGRRCAAEIASTLSVSEATVDAALDRLRACGLLREAHARESPEPVAWRDPRSAPGLLPLLALLDGPVEALIEPLPDDGAPVRVFASFAPRQVTGDAARDGRRLEVFSGRGMSAAEAVSSCLGEAAERLSARFRGDEVAIRAPFTALDRRACDPRSLLQISARQHARRVEWNARHEGRDSVPPPFDEARPVDWTSARPLAGGAPVLLPAAHCCLDYRWREGEARFCPDDSNGLASGPSLEAATRAGICELIERDAAAIWWYGRLRRPCLDPASLEDPDVTALIDWAAGHGRSVHLLDLTTDLRVPVVAAVSAERDGRRVLFGFGCDPNVRRAARLALTEMHQIGVSAALIEANRGRAGDGDLDPSARALCTWLSSATLADERWLAPAAGPPTAAAPESETVGLAGLVERCARRGLDPLVVGLTRADIGVPAVRVVIPGLRHFRPRFAAGRLYQVPVELGWRASPIAEESLNPVPLFL